MNNFSIKDIERLSGIKAHTLRIWEQRHGLYLCKRKQSKHRFYDNEDLKEVLRIAYLYHRGFKVSKIAGLSKKELNELATSNIESDSHEVFINQMIESSLDLDQSRFENIIQNAQRHLDFERMVTKVYYPFLRKMGLLWVTQQVAPAQEHFSSYLIQQKILVEIDKLPLVRPANPVTALLFSPEGDTHEIPLLVMKYLLKRHGVTVIFFGANTPISQIEYYSRNRQSDYIVTHLVTNLTNKEPGDFVDYMLEKFPRQKLVLSGPGFSDLKLTDPRLHMVNEMESFVKVFEN